MATAGTLYVAIKGDAKDLKKSLDSAKSSATKAANKIRSGMNRAGSAIIGVTGAVGALAGAAGLVALNSIVRESIQLAGVQETAERKLEAVLRATGGAAGFSSQELFNMASAFQNVTTVGDETIIGAQAVLATFKQVRGEGFERATAAALDMSAVMGTDLNSSILQVGKALNDPTKGLSMLTRVGVTFTDQQTEMVKSLQASGDMMGAQNIILRELETQFGGAAEAVANTFGGAVTQASNSFGDLQEQIGFIITKNEFFIQIATRVNSVFMDMTRSVGENTSSLQNLANRGLIRVAESIGTVIETMRFLENGWLGIKLVGQTAVVALSKSIAFLVKGLNSTFSPLGRLADFLVRVGVIENNPFDKLETAAESFADTTVDVHREIRRDIEETNDRYDNWREKADGIVDVMKEVEEETRNVAAASDSSTATVVSNQQSQTTAIDGTTAAFVNMGEFGLQSVQDMSDGWDLLIGQIETYDADMVSVNEKTEEARVLTTGFTSGFAQGWRDVQEEQSTFYEVGLASARGLNQDLTTALSNFANPFSDKFLEIENLWDNTLRNLVGNFTTKLAEMAVNFAASEVAGFLGFGGGGGATVAGGGRGGASGGGVGPGGTVSGFDGLSSAFSNTAFSGLQDTTASFLSDTLGLSGAGDFLTDVLPSSVFGSLTAGLGTAALDLFTGGDPTSAALSGLGAGVGFAAFGPLGAIAGSFIADLVGGLFGDDAPETAKLGTHLDYQYDAQNGFSATQSVYKSRNNGGSLSPTVDLFVGEIVAAMNAIDSAFIDQLGSDSSAISQYQSLAGSSVNSYIDSLYLRGDDHLEGDIGRDFMRHIETASTLMTSAFNNIPQTASLTGGGVSIDSQSIAHNGGRISGLRNDEGYIRVQSGEDVISRENVQRLESGDLGGGGEIRLTVVIPELGTEFNTMIDQRADNVIVLRNRSGLSDDESLIPA